MMQNHQQAIKFNIDSFNTLNTHPQRQYRYRYVIGDVQGCYAALLALLNTINFNPNLDCIYFAGDLIARGEDSLSTLKLVYKLNQKQAAYTVLGNHDLNLLSIWRGFRKAKKKDNLASLIEDDDFEPLMQWLRKQPLLILLPQDHLAICHAGIPPLWTHLHAKVYAKELETVLAGPLKPMDAFFEHMYGNTPTVWQDNLTGIERLRCIANYFTRMRLCTAQSELEFDFKDNLLSPMPQGFKPWFEWTRNKTEPKILFGHWAALGAKLNNNQYCAVDGGCVWGGSLVAYRIEDGKIFTDSSQCICMDDPN